MIRLVGALIAVGLSAVQTYRTRAPTPDPRPADRPVAALASLDFEVRFRAARRLGTPELRGFPASRAAVSRSARR